MLAEKLGKTSIKAVYLMVKRSFTNKSTADQKHSAKMKLPDVKTESHDLEGVVCKTESECNDEDESKSDLESFSKIFESNSSIFEIQPKIRMHRGRQTQTQSVKEGWSTKLALFLFEKANLSCKFVFKNVTVLKDGTVKTTGRCECKSDASITWHQGILRVNVENIAKSFQHTRKYQMRGELKDKLAEELKNNNALAVQTQFVNRMIPGNETINREHNPFLCTLNTERIIKHRSRAREEDPIDFILNSIETIYKNIISSVSLYPFVIIFRTPLQLAYYCAESQLHRISISIDATGSVVTPPRRSKKIDGTDKLKHVFLYTIMLKTDGKSVPIAQMLSQDQSSEQIIMFLTKTFKDLKLPSEVVCDESKALLKALSTTFTGYGQIEGYVTACMSSILNGTAPPKCYLRIDRSHFVKNVEKKIKSRDSRKRKLYRGVIGYLIKCDSFESARKIISDFFTVLLNENDGLDEEGEPLPSEVAKGKLLTLCSTHNESLDYADDSDTSEANEIDTNDGLNVNVDTKWIQEIIEAIPIKKKSKECHENLYYDPKATKMYVKLFSTIVMWSNVMNAKFKSTQEAATSSDIESFFKSLKYGILKRKMYPVNEFLEHYIDFANAEIKLIAIPDPKKSKRSKSLEEKRVTSSGK